VWRRSPARRPVHRASVRFLHLSTAAGWIGFSSKSAGLCAGVDRVPDRIGSRLFIPVMIGRYHPCHRSSSSPLRREKASKWRHSRGRLLLCFQYLRCYCDNLGSIEEGHLSVGLIAIASNRSSVPQRVRKTTTHRVLFRNFRAPARHSSRQRAPKHAAAYDWRRALVECGMEELHPFVCVL
jgi:hypothetical protein